MTHFKEVPLIDSPIHEVSMGLFAWNDKKLIVGGTCVLIAEGFAITAKHVVSNLREKFGKNEDGSCNTNFWAVRVLPGPEYAIWEVWVIWEAGLTDVAFLRLKPYNDIADNNPLTKQVILDFIPPKIGSEVVGFGYYGTASESRILFDEKGRGHNLEINHYPATTMGKVVEVYPERRDSVILNFPSFRVDFISKPGMSGGPVFNKTGNLIGIISSGMEGQNITNICLLWPSVLTEIQTTESKKTILDYIKIGVIRAVGYEKIITLPQLGFLY